MATIRRRGPYAFDVRIRRKGYPPLNRTFPTFGEAELWAEEQELQMKKGTFVDRREGERTTIAEAFERYLRDVTPSKKGAKFEQTRIKRLIALPFASRTLADLRGMDVATLRDEWLARLSPSSVQKDLAALSHLYTICRKEWGMEYLTNPVASVRMPKVQNERDRRLNFGEEELLFQHLDAEMQVIVTLALETAMRRGEIQGLQWAWIRGNIVRLPMTKNGSARTVPLSTTALRALASLPRRIDGKVFSITVDTISHKFADACEEAGVKDLRFHDLRHEATSRLFEKGLDVMEVKTITGHKTLTMLARYTHLRLGGLASKLG